MQFFKDFIRNLLILLAVLVFLWIVFPDMVGQAYQLLGALFGPVLILVIAASALPGKSGRRRR